VRYRGQATHAAAYPEQGINAADAFTVAQVAIGLLRQQLLPSTRVHGIVTHGGDAPNAIPDRTEGRWYVRAETLDELAGLEPRVRRCFEAGALATGCELEIEADAPPYAEFRNDPDLLPLYRANAERLGRQFLGTGPDGAAGGDAASASRMNRASTDMGNVSLVVPAIHPYIGIGSLPAVNHQKEFAAHCVTPVADQALIDGAIGLAWTAADAARDEVIRGRLLAGGR
jgi:metal-dependent amidase/aminoacylase/carboxypeptidase family protein